MTRSEEAPDLCLEAGLWEAGIDHIAGVDEVGRGALAGPVAAAALILPADPTILYRLQGVRDSKQMTAVERAEWSPRLREAALAWGVGFASHAEIDWLGIVPATRHAMQRAIEALIVPPNHLLIDYLLLPDVNLPQTALIKGDARSLSIAGASILAKTARDALLVTMDEEFPGYGFGTHKGYCTPGHVASLANLGPCAIHRKTFAPISLTI